MEKLAYTYQTTKPVTKKVHVGVVGSGDLEILLFQQTNKKPPFQFVQEVTALAMCGKMS